MGYSYCVCLAGWLSKYVARWVMQQIDLPGPSLEPKFCRDVCVVV